LFTTNEWLYVFGFDWEVVEDYCVLVMKFRCLTCEGFFNLFFNKVFNLVRR
jgi:hypothetical protein